MTQPQGPDLSDYRSTSARPARRRPPVETEERDPVDPPPATPRAQPAPNRNPDDVQLNVRISREHREMLDELRSVHPRRRAKLRDVLEDLIEEAHTKKRKQIESKAGQR